MWILNAEWSCKQILNGPQMGPLLQIKKLLEIGTSPFYYKDIFYYARFLYNRIQNAQNFGIFFSSFIKQLNSTFLTIFFRPKYCPSEIFLLKMLKMLKMFKILAIYVISAC